MRQICIIFTSRTTENSLNTRLLFRMFSRGGCRNHGCQRRCPRISPCSRAKKIKKNTFSSQRTILGRVNIMKQNEEDDSFFYQTIGKVAWPAPPPGFEDRIFQAACHPAKSLEAWQVPVVYGYALRAVAFIVAVILGFSSGIITSGTASADSNNLASTSPYESPSVSLANTVFRSEVSQDESR
jgi:hypothetical protein